MKYKHIILMLLVLSFVYAESGIIENFLDGVTLIYGNNTIIIEESDEMLIDVFPEDCSKLGFVYMPGHSYDFIKETIQFTGYEGWALGIAFSRDDNFEFALQDMTVFVEETTKQKLTPVIKILGNNWQDEIMPVDSVVSFINNLSEATDEIIYVQIWDKPNIAKEFQKPIDYADYLIDIK